MKINKFKKIEFQVGDKAFIYKDLSSKPNPRDFWYKDHRAKQIFDTIGGSQEIIIEGIIPGPNQDILTFTLENQKLEVWSNRVINLRDEHYKERIKLNELILEKIKDFDFEYNSGKVTFTVEEYKNARGVSFKLENISLDSDSILLAKKKLKSIIQEIIKRKKFYLGFVIEVNWSDQTTILTYNFEPVFLGDLREN